MSLPNSTASPRFASTFAEAETFDGADELVRAWGRGVRPDAALTVSQWADAHRMLESRASAEPGRYRTARTPTLRWQAAKWSCRKMHS